jgi:hypothetical protein
MIDKKALIGMGGMLALFLLLTSPAAVFATNGQTPNQQILSSNASTDNLSWGRLSMISNEQFHFSSPDDNYSYQLNFLINGGTYACGCAYPWFLQAVVPVTNNDSGTKGAYVGEGVNEIFDGANFPLFCYQYPSQVVGQSAENVNHTGYVVLEQDTLNTTSKVTYHMSVANGGGTDLWTYTQTCTYPNSYTVKYINQEEGVIVGGYSSAHASFSPLRSTVFYGYIDLVSNYNDMSHASKPTNTGETSNLYQHPTEYLGEAYGSSMYLYTVQSDENTTSAT